VNFEVAELARVRGIPCPNFGKFGYLNALSISRIEENDVGLTDEQLIEQTLTGNTNAFGELVKRYQGIVVGLAFHIVGNMQDAQDIGQEVFIKAYQNLSQLKQPAKFSSWLRRITENTCKTWLRLNQKKRETLSFAGMQTVVSAQQPDDVLLAKELSETVKNAISELSEPNRLAVTLFYMDGLSYKEVSKFLDISVGAVKGRLHKAREQLKKGLITMVKDDFSKTKPKEESTQKVMEAIAVGRVVTEEGEPVEDAIIRVRAREDDAYGRFPREQVRTDTDGRYRYPVSSPEQASYGIRAEHSDFLSSQEAPFVVEEEGEVDIPDLVMRPQLLRAIQGRVTNEQGEPIEGARLCSIYHRDRDYHADRRKGNYAVTDSDGCYVIDRWTEGYLLFAKAEGYTTAVINLLELTEFAESDHLLVDFVLKPAFPTAGRVLDAGGQPLEGVYVGFNYPRQRRGYLDPWHTRTDSEGRFCVYELPEGPMRVLISCDGYREIRWQDINAGDTNIELVMQPINTAKIAGRVVDARTQKPIKNFTYYVDYPDVDEVQPHVSYPLPRELRMDGCEVKSEDGFFTMSELSLDVEVDVIVAADGYAPARICNVHTTLEQESEPLTFALEPARAISGRVVDAETMQPAANVFVRHFCAARPLVDMLPSVQRLAPYGSQTRHSPHAKFGGQLVATDTNGLFVIDTVGKSGSYLYITSQDEEKAYAPSVVGPIEFDEDEQKRGLRVLLRAGGTIKGTAPELSERRRKMLNKRSKESVWIVSRDIPHLNIEHGFVLDEKRQFTFEHVMPGKWRLEHCFYPYGLRREFFVEKKIHLELEDGETISEPFQNRKYFVASEPAVQPEDMSFGTVYVDSVVEARLILRGIAMMTSLTMPEWVRCDNVRDYWGGYFIDITADTTSVGTHKGKIRFQTDVGELSIPLSISVVNSAAPRKKLLWTYTVFDGYSGSSTAPIDELIRERNLDIDFTRHTPPDLEKYQCIVLSTSSLYDIWTEDIQRLHTFVKEGGRLIIGANRFYRGTVQSANQIVRRYGLEMLDTEPYREVDIDILPENLATDFQRALLQDASKLHFFRASPIASQNPDAIIVRHPDDETVAYVAMAKENGEVILIGQSLLLNFIAEEEHRRFFTNMLFAEL